MAHMIAKNEAGESLMVSTTKEWHYFDTSHPILPTAYDDATYNEWKEKSGMSQEYETTPAYQIVGNDSEGNAIYGEIPGQFFVRRKSDFQVYNFVSEQFTVFQPSELIDFGREFVDADSDAEGKSRFSLETAMTLKNGALLCCSYGFREDINVMGEAHKLFLLLSTAMDGTRSTTFQGVMGRVVCNNTFQAYQHGAATYKLGHRSKWTQAAKEEALQTLENVLMGAAHYKKLAEALAMQRMAKDVAIKFLRSTIFTPKLIEAEQENGKMVKVMSQPGTQEKRRMEEIEAAYEKTLKEGTEKDTAWTVFNTLTRYADHDMAVRKRDGKSEDMARDESRLFGAGQTFKSKAISNLLKSLELNPKAIEVAKGDLEKLAA